MDGVDLISIIIPAYRPTQADIERCLTSCDAQTYPKIEVLVMANGMTEDENRQLESKVKKHSHAVMHCCAEKGVSNARNEGIALAKGEWLVFLDADDFLEPAFCTVMRKKAIENSSDIVLCSVKKELPGTAELIRMEPAESFARPEQFLAGLLNVQRGYGFAHSKLWRAEFIRQNKLRFDSSLSLAEDAQFCMEAAGHEPRVFLCGEILYHYNCVSNSAVRTFRPDYAERYLTGMQAIYRTLQTAGVPWQRTDFSNFVAYHVLLICVNYCFHPQNGLPYHEQKALLKQVLGYEIFHSAVAESDYRYLSLTRKVTLWALKRRLFFCVKLISVIRHRQKQKNSR